MAKKLKGWHRTFIVFAGVWTVFMIIELVIAVVQTGNSPYLAFYLLWLAPIGLVYVFGWGVGWIIRGFRKDN